MPPDERFLSLLRAAPQNLRPIHSRDLHITLAFLGDCDAEKCNAVWELLEADPPPPWKARLELPRHFGSRTDAYGYPLTGDEVFLQWLRRRRPLLNAAGTNRDSRPMQLHLTMAWRTGSKSVGSAAWLERLQLLTGDTIQLRGVAIYCRDDQPDGRRYRPIRITP